MPPPQHISEDLIEQGDAIPIARVQAMHEGETGGHALVGQLLQAMARNPWTASRVMRQPLLNQAIDDPRNPVGRLSLEGDSTPTPDWMRQSNAKGVSRRIPGG